MYSIDLAVLDRQGIPLRTWLAKDGRGVKGQIESVGESCVRVGEETNLNAISTRETASSLLDVYSLRLPLLDPSSRPTPSSYTVKLNGRVLRE